jgi:hypothetical protein
LPWRIQAIELADRREAPIIHGARPESSGTVALAVIKAETRRIGAELEQCLAATGVDIECVDAAAHAGHQPTAVTEGD